MLQPVWLSHLLSLARPRHSRDVTRRQRTILVGGRRVRIWVVLQGNVWVHLIVDESKVSVKIRN